MIDIPVLWQDVSHAKLANTKQYIEPSSYLQQSKVLLMTFETP